jgi:hydroxyacylglutathione hydrolase
VRLSREIHLVASGSGGFDLTDPYDCHAYLVVSRGEAVLVDAGIGSGVEDLLANVAAAGVAPERLRALLLTHAHPDHSGAAAALRRRVPGLEVQASSEVAEWVRSGDEDAMSLARGKRAGLYPPEYRFDPCPEVSELRDGQRLRVGALELEAIATPGHSAGHLAFIADGGERSTCFAGDLVFYGGQVSLESNWDCSLGDYATSVERLARRSFEALLPGHHSISLNRGHRHVARAAAMFEDGFVPRSVV